MTCPYERIIPDDDDAMHMIGHDCEDIQFDVWEMFGDFFPASICDTAQRVELHRVINDFPKDTFPMR